VLVDDRHEDLDLAPGEMAVEDRLGHAGLAGDLLDLGVAVAPLAEQLPCRLEEAGAPFLPGEANLLGHTSYLT
jgi:hypothetical protein